MADRTRHNCFNMLKPDFKNNPTPIDPDWAAHHERGSLPFPSRETPTPSAAPAETMPEKVAAGAESLRLDGLKMPHLAPSGSPGPLPFAAAENSIGGIGGASGGGFFGGSSYKPPSARALEAQNQRSQRDGMVAWPATTQALEEAENKLRAARDPQLNDDLRALRSFGIDLQTSPRARQPGFISDKIERAVESIIGFRAGKEPTENPTGRPVQRDAAVAAIYYSPKPSGGRADEVGVAFRSRPPV